MNAISSLLNHKHNELVLGLMAELSRDFGVDKGLWPHFSFHVAAQYSDALCEELRARSREIPPIVIKTAGLGIFTGPEPVVYVSIVRDKQLSALHQYLWQLGEEFGQYGSELYEPAGWVPHITLTRISGRPYILPEMIRVLSERDFHWQIPIDNVSILSNDDDNIRLKYRWTLEGESN